MGMAFVGILAGIGTTFVATDSHRQDATAEAVLRSYAERMRRPDRHASTSTARRRPPTARRTVSACPRRAGRAVVTSVGYWQGDTAPATFTASVLPPTTACNS